MPTDTLSVASSSVRVVPSIQGNTEIIRAFLEREGHRVPAPWMQRGTPQARFVTTTITRSQSCCQRMEQKNRQRNWVMISIPFDKDCKLLEITCQEYNYESRLMLASKQDYTPNHYNINNRPTHTKPRRFGPFSSLRPIRFSASSVLCRCFI